MAYRYTDQNREEYYSAGLTILRGLIPPSLLRDLRQEAETARDIARRDHGPQTQRLQPVYQYSELNPARFRDFLALPELRTTVSGILGPDHSASDIMGILFEPRDTAWATAWHRDWGHNYRGIDTEAFYDAALHKPGMFNQLNGALYDDHSLWVVPGSHRRYDTPEEQACFGGQIPPPGPPRTSEMSLEEQERTCLDYTRQMPGAVNIVLAAGDIAFYRAVGWHIGNYVPYAKRATLHDGFYGPNDRVWQANVPKAVP